ncbi:hypothetical protein K443DRAFT_598799 [Laccaria amethystina LaAM-08-1]|uniref:Uncharacterized protein n=1 Tax=Laccaria amethystina LaAM-08-1 TaxID=1095629 RepID=A0A0C9WQN3_9AGAR|nr:hypothetical protein K443DRAFT_598799 [Laccaria amethystina LaAM-08-1]
MGWLWISMGIRVLKSRFPLIHLSRRRRPCYPSSITVISPRWRVHIASYEPTHSATSIRHSTTNQPH